MAEVKEWSRWRILRGLIESEIEDKMWGVYAPDESPNEIGMAISPELNVVHVILDPSSFELQDFIQQHEGWHIESATSCEDAVDKADLYFDLR